MLWLQSKATKMRPDDGCCLVFMKHCLPGVFSGEIEEMAEKYVYTFVPYLLKNGMVNAPDQATRDFCCVIGASSYLSP